VLIGHLPATAAERALLGCAFDRPAVEPLVHPIDDAAAAQALGPGVAPVSAHPDAGPRTGRQRLLDLWAAIVEATDKPDDVRVLLLPGAPPDEILLARAMGVPIGRPLWVGEPDLAATLLNGATGIVPLPRDPMTIRAFLNPGYRAPDLEPHRNALAAALHARYLADQRDRKPADDPAMRPWEALSPWLRASNLAVIDDIPHKLAAVGLRLDTCPDRAPEGDWPPSLGGAGRDRLAEMEHGRYNAERLQSGWGVAARDLARFESPHLVPWTELKEDIKKYDYEAIDNLAKVLAERGIGLRPV
jgi:hypothetical protein